jgi:UDP-2,3-diacylglucosamine hydrolase
LLQPNKKAYFASDLHLKKGPDEDSRQREKNFVAWLDAIKADAGIIFLLGDMFDYWFEYRYVVPHGFVRFLGKLQELTEAGVAIHYFTGNHDMWMLDYLSVETGVTIHRKPMECQINDCVFLLGHGHNLGPVSFSEKLLMAIFGSRFLKIFFAAIHPYWTMSFGHAWSAGNREKHGWATKFSSINKERIVLYAREQLKQKHFDFFIFGHRHLAMDVRLSAHSRYINTGEWVNNDAYAVFDGISLNLLSFKGGADILMMDASPLSQNNQ